jgi:hypothetical protein
VRNKKIADKQAIDIQTSTSSETFARRNAEKCRAILKTSVAKTRQDSR